MASKAVAVSQPLVVRQAQQIARLSRRSGSRRKAKFTIPLAVAAGFMPLATDVFTQIRQGKVEDAARVMVHNLIGYNTFGGQASWDADGLKHGLYPILAGLGIHKLASALGINRMIARAGIPIIRI